MAGYKWTDIGVIPEDWDVMPISSLCEIVSGGTPSTANPAFWFKGDKPWCTPSDITGTSGKYLYKTDRNITSLGLSKSSANLLPEGTLLLCSRATIGEVKIAKTKIATNQGFKSLVCNSIDNEFMYYKVLTLKDKLLQFSIGSTFLEFSKKDIARLHIDVPKPEEQKAIAAALSDVDGLIESLEQLIAKKRDMKTAVMQQLLTGKKRLPGFDGGWEEKSIKEIAPLQRGFDLPKSQIKKGNIPVAYSNGIMAYHNKAMVKGPGVYTGRSGTIGKANYIASDYWPHNTSLWVTNFFDNDPKFVFYLYGFIGFSRFSSGSGVPTLNRNDAHDFRCIIPKPEEQAAIATILSDMDTEIDALEQRFEKVRSLKTGMMQELLTGKTRLIQPIKRIQKLKSKRHEHFEDAVIIAVLADRFGTRRYPLGRFRYTKFSYLLRRHIQQSTEQYLKKAAGPYNPRTRYSGAEKIARDKKYVQVEGKGFIAGRSVYEAKEYFSKWFGLDLLDWLEQFRKIKNEHLELWTTVDVAMQELRRKNKKVTVDQIKGILESHQEWKDKLKKKVFSDINIQRAINKSLHLFGH